MLQFTKDDVMYVIELGVMMLLGLVVLFMVIRPLVRRAHPRRGSDRRRCPPSLQSAGGVNVVQGAGGDHIGRGRRQRARRRDRRRQKRSPAQTAPPQMIDVAQVQGQVHAQSVHRSANWPRKPERNRIHCSSMAPRGRGVI
jgi:flagellar M-ring protein FliF